MCIPKFDNSVTFACILELIQMVRNGDSAVDIITKALWVAGCITTSYQAVPGVLHLHANAELTVESKLDQLCNDISDMISVTEHRALGIDWMAVLAIIMEIIKLIPQREQ